MTTLPDIVARGMALSVLALFLVLSACHSSSTNSSPAIVFSRVPAATQEAPGKTDTIEGRATGVRPGQRIILYSKTDGRWGLQSRSGQPFTNIESNGQWRTSTQLGIEYAALLVDPTYNPPEQSEFLPNVGTGVAALAAVKGQG